MLVNTCVPDEPGESRDPLIVHMKKRGIPITRENYLALDFPEGAPDPFPAELEAGLPAVFRWK